MAETGVITDEGDLFAPGEESLNAGEYGITRAQLAQVPLYTRAAKKTDPPGAVVDGRVLTAGGEKLLAELEKANTQPLCRVLEVRLEDLVPDEVPAPDER